MYLVMKNSTGNVCAYSITVRYRNELYTHTVLLVYSVGQTSNGVGGDTAEDVFGGLDAVLKLSWPKDGTKVQNQECNTTIISRSATNRCCKSC